MREDEGAALVGVLDELDDLRRRVEVAALGDHADQVGVGGRLETQVDVQVEDAALDPAGPGRGDDEVEDRIVVLGVVGLGPHLTHRAEPEGLRTVLDHDRDLVHGDSLPHRWQEINEHCHSCHWWQQCDGRRITAMTTFALHPHRHRHRRATSSATPGTTTSPARPPAPTTTTSSARSSFAATSSPATETHRPPRRGFAWMTSWRQPGSAPDPGSPCSSRARRRTSTWCSRSWRPASSRCRSTRRSPQPSGTRILAPIAPDLVVTDQADRRGPAASFHGDRRRDLPLGRPDPLHERHHRDARRASSRGCSRPPTPRRSWPRNATCGASPPTT